MEGQRKNDYQALVIQVIFFYRVCIISYPDQPNYPKTVFVNLQLYTTHYTEKTAVTL